jgi:sterol desaturase/sphingolipid hydroxylase (fatty acid hydroxylase superfamily)
VATPGWPYAARMKSRHLAHHYKDCNKNFGVTSSFWDIVFGTVYNDE